MIRILQLPVTPLLLLLLVGGGQLSWCDCLAWLGADPHAATEFACETCSGGDPHHHEDHPAQQDREPCDPECAMSLSAVPLGEGLRIPATASTDQPMPPWLGGVLNAAPRDRDPDRRPPLHSTAPPGGRPWMSPATTGRFQI